ncbi:hypothetical protein R5R73_01815 [Salinicola sp. LHM]|uniref:hypothetical protein n=1 Tax=Halomonadaceae TaxID=28256 RepID=UPI002ACD52FC|nr:hypothetical protein [Salinicola sp. LHM]WQH33453.1 hypothetical protein R5R73_01815 [Salinicola sp. LHM]
MSDYLNHQLASEDIDVILAALRLLQRTIDLDIPDAIQTIGGESLKTVDINDLCERLNLDGQPSDQDARDVLIKRFRAELSRPEWNSDTAANLATALADAGWPIFHPGHEGWFLDVVDGAYSVMAKPDGPFRSNAEVMSAIARQFAAGSRWHGQVLDTIGMTACGHGQPMLRVVGFGLNAQDVVVANDLMPERSLEIGRRPEFGVWSICRRNPQSFEAEWVADRSDCRSALQYCADRLGADINDEIVESFLTYFR